VHLKGSTPAVTVAGFRFHLKRSHSHKRRWGTLIEAAKTGKVSRLIGRSRSEDSVCNNCRESGRNHSHSHSNSPASDDNGSVRSSDSNPSLDAPPEPELHGLAHGLALLKKKRKKFSASRNTSPIVPAPARAVASVKKPPKKVLVDRGGVPIQRVTLKLQIPQVLKRASSVPTRVPEVALLGSRHDKVQSQQDSVEVPASAPPTLTPSTTEESVAAVGQGGAVGASSREPLLYCSSSSNQATGSSQTPEDEFKGNNSHSLPKLPGVIPLSGHNGPTGWL
jgi:transient receptor potential cation channel subfamily C protein 4